MKDRHPEPLAASKTHRVLSSALGLLFIGLAAVILLLAERATLAGSLVAALVLLVLGVDALIAVARGRRSLLSRIGPLP